MYMYMTMVGFFKGRTLHCIGLYNLVLTKMWELFEEDSNAPYFRTRGSVGFRFYESNFVCEGWV